MMKEKGQFILNIIAVISFIAYGIGIYLFITVLGEDWGNIAVDLAIQSVGPLAGVILVIAIGAFILFLTLYIQKTRHTNVLLCWFWILSLYQCAINTFLQIQGLPDEPINQFFKILIPEFWYPTKELVFLAVSLLLTYIWIKKISKEDFTKLDLLLITLAASLLVGGTVISQIFLLS